jgi:hypothetical protein
MKTIGHKSSLFEYVSEAVFFVIDIFSAAYLSLNWTVADGSCMESLLGE